MEGIQHIEKMEELISKLYGDVHDNTVHIEILNKEGGEMRDEQKKMNATLTALAIQHAEIKTNTDWLMKFFWIIATASAGSMVASILNLILTK